MTLEELEIVVKANVEQATKQLENLKAQMDSNKNFDAISKQSEEMGKSFEQSNEQASDLSQTLVKKLAPAMVKGAGGSASMGSAVSGLASSLGAVAPVLLAVVGVIAEIKIKLEILKLEIKAITKIIKGVFYPAIKVIGDLLKKTADLIRGQLSQAFTTLKQKMTDGINNLSQVSTKLNSTLSELKSNLTQTGNALATAVAPVIEAVIPLMNSLLATVTNLANGLAQITASLFGNSTTFKRAKKVNEDYAKSLNGVGKEAKGVLASFDELNVISEQSSGGGVSVDDMFEDVEIDAKIQEMASKIKALWNADNVEGLEEFGKDIGNKVKEQIDKLPAYDWAKGIGNKLNNALALVNGFLSTRPAKNLGSKLAEIILGFIDGLKAEQVGKFIANIINNAFGFVAGFVEKMNKEDGWKKLAKWLSDTINTAFENIDAQEIGRTISGLVSGLLDMAIEFLENTDWVLVGNQIAEILINIDWLDILTKLIRAIWDVWNALQTVRMAILLKIAGALYNWLDEKKREIINKIINAMLEFLNVIEVNGLGIGNTLKVVWNKVVEWFKENVAPKLKLAFWSEKLKPLKDSIGNAFKEAFNGVINIVEKAVNIIIRKVNTIHWELPDWLGGWEFGFNLREIKIPRLAQGGVIENPTIALMGEYAGANQNPEIVAPQKVLLETSQQANIPVMNAIEEMGDKLVSALNSIGVYAEFDYSKLKVGLDNENYRVGGKLYGI